MFKADPLLLQENNYDRRKRGKRFKVGEKIAT